MLAGQAPVVKLMCLASVLLAGSGGAQARAGRVDVGVGLDWPVGSYAVQVMMAPLRLAEQAEYTAV